METKLVVRWRPRMTNDSTDFGFEPLHQSSFFTFVEAIDLPLNHSRVWSSSKSIASTHEPGRQTEGYSSSYHLPPLKLRLLDNAWGWCLPMLGYFSERGDADGMNVVLCWLLFIAERMLQTGCRNIQTRKACLGTAMGIKIFMLV